MFDATAYASPSSYLLEMTLVVGILHEVGSLAKEGVDPRGNDHRFDLALLAGGAGVAALPGVASHGEGLASESRLEGEGKEGGM